jgi:hypothetical protein
MIVLLDCECFVSNYLFLNSFYLTLCQALNNIHNDIFYQRPQHRKHVPPSSPNIIPMIPTCYGIFPNTYSLNMWWTKLLGLPISTYTSSYLLQLLCIVDPLFFTKILLPESKPPEILVGLSYKVVTSLFNNLFFYPSIHCFVLFTTMVERFLCSFLATFKFFLTTYVCPFSGSYLQSLVLKILSLSYNGVFFTSVLSLCPLSLSHRQRQSNTQTTSTPILFPVGNDDNILSSSNLLHGIGKDDIPSSKHLPGNSS